MSGPERVRLPSALDRALECLETAGRRAHLVGRSAAELWSGEQPLEFEIATDAAADELLALFPNAVPVTAVALLLPTAAGPVDVLTGPRGAPITGHLERRDFTRNALAIDRRGAVLDPHGARADLRARRLRCVGDAAARLAEDPVRALRATRLVATLNLRCDPALERALPGAAPALGRRPAIALRTELCALLLGGHARRGLELLRRGGIEAELAPGARADAAAVVGALPRDLDLRLAGWLRGTRAVRCLRRLRLPRERVVAVERLLQLHPVPLDPTSIPRLLRRSPELVDALFSLRRAELIATEDDDARSALEELRAQLERARTERRRDRALAIDGRAVMETLGCGPGPEVGRALAWLRKAVLADPDCNTPERLRALLRSGVGKEDGR